MSFEIVDNAATSLVLLFRNQSVEMAPSIMDVDGDIKKEIIIKGHIESLGRSIAQRFSDYINLFFGISLDLNSLVIEYIPVTDEERKAMRMYGFNFRRERQNPPLPFNMMAMAFFAVESKEDPSFISHMHALARDALVSEKYIDAFRYSFLLVEALYGNGKFQKKDLVKNFLSNSNLLKYIENTINITKNDFSKNKVILKYNTSEKLLEYLVDRRGFYFHGNLKHKDAWRPDKAIEAKPIAELMVNITMQIASNFSTAMFEAGINDRFMSDARHYGAVMTIHVQFEFVDDQGIERVRQIEFEVPGTKVTSDLAIKVNSHFLKCVEADLSGLTLRSARAIVSETGVEVFRSQFLRPS